MRFVTIAALMLAAPLAAQAPKSSKPKTPAVPPVVLPCGDSDSTCAAPELRREFRGVWVASVGNIDWPSKPGLTTEEQKAELLAILDRSQALHLNAIVFQVRPAADALYKSSIEPWSEYLTGKQGQAPSPAWDPLAFAVEQAHLRGLELHAWFNPYRARQSSAKGPLSKKHIANTAPSLVKSYGKNQLWMDPGEPAVRKRTLRVVVDVVKRYDIDGVHLDDYFYPYKEKLPNGSTEFPDGRSWKKYVKSGGKLARDDWRRENVNTLIRELNDQIHAAKPWVKFGISPFGIWRPGNPEQVKGFDAYEQLYADSKLWWEKNWVDYFTPQLYWTIAKPEQSFPVLMRWWGAQNPTPRHLWVGMYTGRVREGNADSANAGGSTPMRGAWTVDEIAAQLDSIRAYARASGAVHFSMKSLLTDKGGVATRLASGVYSDFALIPPSPWLAKQEPSAPVVKVEKNLATGGYALTMSLPKGQVARWFLVQSRVGGVWGNKLVASCDCAEQIVPNGEGKLPDRLVISALDRAGVASASVRLAVVR